MFFRYFIVAVPAVGVAEQQHAVLLSAALHVLQGQVALNLRELPYAENELKVGKLLENSTDDAIA